jgi:hypothetical protein
MTSTDQMTRIEIDRLYLDHLERDFPRRPELPLATACCSVDDQATCCAPADNAACCDGTATGSCGCR